MTCAECAELLLDYLYGLLDDESAQVLREHLAGCAACQLALARAKSQQNLFACAARQYRDVPLFQKPAEESAPLPQLAVLPERKPQRPAVPAPQARTSRRWRRWTGVAAAATVLLTVTVLYAQYQTGLSQRQQGLTKARKEVEKVDAFFASFKSEFKDRETNLRKEVLGQFLHLHVVGPATYHPGAANVYRITTLNPEGEPTTARIIVRLLDDDNQDLFPAAEYTIPVAGDLRVVLPRLSIAAGTAPILVVEARKSLNKMEVKEVVRQKLQVEEATYLTHLSVNKSVLRAGDILFFRTAALERYSLTPVEAGVPMAFTLCRRLPPHRRVPQELEAVKQLFGSTDAAGVAFGEFAITADLPEGDYVLVAAEVVEADEKGVGIKSAVHSLRVNRDDAPPVAQVVLDQRQYQPGQPITGKFRGQSKAANQTVVITTKAGPKALDCLQLNTDAFGNAPFSIPTKNDMPPGQVQMECEVHYGGKKNEIFKETVPVVKLDLRGEFFPEGGDLVAGVPNRVFFRLNVPLWARPGLQCTLVDGKRQTIAEAAIGPAGNSGQTALGQFTFTPRFGEVYHLRVVADGGQVVLLPMPGSATSAIKQLGLVLSTPSSVLAPTDPLRLHLWTTRKNTELLVVASCRGRIVDQKELLATDKFTEVVLEPAPGASGVLRITVFEKRQSETDWRPLAERLVYRLPSEYLKLSALPHKGTRKAYGLGEKVTLQLDVRNEADAPTTACLNVLVIDAKAQAPADVAHAGVGPFFLMTTELRHPEDLENADFLLTDTPGAVEALELYLGTQGWRAFRDNPSSSPTTLKVQDADNAGLVPEVFAAGTRLEHVYGRYRGKVAQAGHDLHKDGDRKIEELQLEREHALSGVERAEDEVDDFRLLPWRYLRPAVGVLLLLLIAAGIAWLLAGLMVLVRGRRSPRFCLVSAFCTLLLAVVVYGVTGRLRTDQGAGAGVGEKPRPEPIAQGKPFNWSLGELPQDAPKKARGELERVDAGKELRLVFCSPAAKAGEKLFKEAPADETRLVLRDLAEKETKQQLRQAVQENEGAAAKKAAGSPAVQERIGYLLTLEKMNGLNQSQGGGYGGGGPFAPGANYSYNKDGKDKKSDMAKAGAGGKGAAGVEKRKEGKAAGDTALLKEYAHINTVGVHDYQDTVLWNPALATPNGTGQVTFELSGQETTYHIVVYGHTANGRLGVFHGKFHAK